MPRPAACSPSRRSPAVAAGGGVRPARTVRRRCGGRTDVPAGAARGPHARRAGTGGDAGPERRQPHAAARPPPVMRTCPAWKKPRSSAPRTSPARRGRRSTPCPARRFSPRPSTGARPDYGVPGGPGYGLPHRLEPTNRYGVWYRPSSFHEPSRQVYRPRAVPPAGERGNCSTGPVSRTGWTTPGTPSATCPAATGRPTTRTTASGPSASSAPVRAYDPPGPDHAEEPRRRTDRDACNCPDCRAKRGG